MFGDFQDMYIDFSRYIWHRRDHGLARRRPGRALRRQHGRQPVRPALSGGSVDRTGTGGLRFPLRCRSFFRPTANPHATLPLPVPCERARRRSRPLVSPPPKRRLREPRLPQGPGRFRAHPDAAALGRLRRRRLVRVGATSSWSTRAASSTTPCTNRSMRSARRSRRTASVIVTGCLGAKPETITERHPSVLKVTGPQAYEEVVDAVHEHLPPQHDPFVDLVPPQGIRLTPRHYAYLKISEGCNHRCSFCIIPSMRGDLASRPIGDVMGEAERLVRAGVKELLVISQDTSAYGVGPALCHRLLGRQAAQDAVRRAGARAGLARRLGAAALRLSVSARRQRHSADGRRQGAAVPRHPVPARQPARPQAHAAARARGEHAGAHPSAGARSAPTSRCAARSSSAFPGETEQDFAVAARLAARQRSSIAWAASSTRPWRVRRRTRCPGRCPTK